jgi:hypothetical protein
MSSRMVEWIDEVSAQRDWVLQNFPSFLPFTVQQRSQQNMERDVGLCCWQHNINSVGVPTNTDSTKLCLNYVMLLTSHRVLLRRRNFEWITSCKSSSLLFKAFHCLCLQYTPTTLLHMCTIQATQRVYAQCHSDNFHCVCLPCDSKMEDRLV